MSQTTVPWDYLVVTASNDAQAKAYRSQLERRRGLGELSRVKEVLVVADPHGQRVGSGGSTLCCLMEIANREAGHTPAARLRNAADAVSLFRGRRILIIHAGGDSRRLPAYGPCGKIFVPVSNGGNKLLGETIFDRLAPAFLELPPALEGEGQVVIASGDALILLDPTLVNLAHPGLTALTCADAPEHSSKHGVFIEGQPGKVKRYLQKPSPSEQTQEGAVNSQGQSLLDIGIMSFDSSMVAALFRAFNLVLDGEGQLDWPPEKRQLVLGKGADFYREICCAMGTEATADHHRRQASRAGSQWTRQELEPVYQSLKDIPFHLHILPQAQFLHFGTTRQLISSGTELRKRDHPAADTKSPLLLNNRIEAGGGVAGQAAWVEGCHLRAPLSLPGPNAVIGVDVDDPLELPASACLEVLLGQSRSGRPAWFVRCYGMGDSFKDPFPSTATFCDRPMRDWLDQVGMNPGQVWGEDVPETQRTLWNARVFPAVPRPGDYRHWLWMFNPSQATPAQKKSFQEIDRYSAAEILGWADQEAFFKRREQLRTEV